MSLETLRQAMPDYAKDIKLNLSKVLSEDGAEGLTLNQIYMTALASSYATKNETVIKAITEEASETLSDAEINAAKAAATIMGMNNIYYRFVHLSSDKSYATMPANLRMNVIANSGVDKVDFEVMSLAVSSINGCGMCIDSHAQMLEKAGLNKTGIQSSIRNAATLSAAAQALVIEAI